MHGGASGQVVEYWTYVAVGLRVRILPGSFANILEQVGNLGFDNDGHKP